MLFSSVATDSLLLFAMFGSFFTIFPAVIIQLLKLMMKMMTMCRITGNLPR